MVQFTPSGLVAAVEIDVIAEKTVPFQATAYQVTFVWTIGKVPSVQETPLLFEDADVKLPEEPGP